MTGPTVRRRLLGKELRQIRDEADMTREDVAKLLGCSPTKVTYLETGRNVIGKTELIVLLQHCLAGAKLSALEELREEASKRGWWSTARLPEWLAAYVGLEDDASSVRIFEDQLIPGLLQTEAYARDLHVLSGRLADGEVNKRVRARMQRQARLTGSRRLKVTAVIAEPALQYCAAHGAVGLDQLASLIERSRQSNIELRVLPVSVGLHRGMSGAFSLLRFPDDLLPDAAWQEYALGGHLIDDEDAVAYLSKLFDELRCQALAANESLAVISEFIDHSR